MKTKCLFLLVSLLWGSLFPTQEIKAVPVADSFRVLVLTERGGQHGGFTDAGLAWLKEQGIDNHFTITEINNTKPITEQFLSQFKLIIQLDYTPYNWTKEAQAAFTKYIEEGMGGWIGFHHASLLGEFDGFPMWDWFSDFMGGIRWKDYIAQLASARVNVEDATHPVMKGVHKSFIIPDDEWYTFDISPRPNIKVLAHVDEKSYTPASDITMGDHPVIWTNPLKKARNVYFLFGHTKKLYDNKDFTTLFLNAILWAKDTYKDVYAADYASEKRFKAMVYYSPLAEEAHVQFAEQGVDFFQRLNYGDGFSLVSTTDFSQYASNLDQFDVIVMLNASPNSPSDRVAFEKYMENGGGWVGFHGAAYNDKNTKWPWFVQFLGGGVFYCNNWPPQPVKVVLDCTTHEVTKNLPSTFTAPASEWYQWTPSPRQNPNVEVLLSISPDNYPLGIKDVVKFGDFPIVWTNTSYRMIYLNMGHGDLEFTDATQNLLFVNALRWVVSQNKKGNPFLNNNKTY